MLTASPSSRVSGGSSRAAPIPGTSAVAPTGTRRAYRLREPLQLHECRQEHARLVGPEVGIFEARGPDLDCCCEGPRILVNGPAVPGEENDPRISLDVLAASAAGESGDHEEQGHGAAERAAAPCSGSFCRNKVPPPQSAHRPTTRQLVDVSGQGRSLGLGWTRSAAGTPVGLLSSWPRATSRSYGRSAMVLPPCWHPYLGRRQPTEMWLLVRRRC
jgi:hypothetical protein